MSLPLVELLERYGYLAVLAATLLEGETLLVLAGFASHQGHLDFGRIVLVAFVGGALGDQFYFWLGRLFGPQLVHRWARLAIAAKRVGTLLQRHDAPLIFGIRFMYGLRIAGPIAMGALGVSPARFAVFNLLGAAVWAPVVTGAGYLSGHALQALVGDLERYEAMGIVLVAACALLFALAHGWWRSRNRGETGD